MHRYKGSGCPMSIKAYERLLCFLSSNGVKLVSNYYGATENSDFELLGLRFTTTPDRLKSVMKNYWGFLNTVMDNNDQVFKIIDFTRNGFIIDIITYDKELIRFTKSAYIQFVKSRKNFNETVLSRGHKALTPYIGARGLVLVEYCCGHEPSWVAPSDYKRSVGCPKCAGQCHEQSAIDFEKLVKENGHELLSPYTNETQKVLIDYNCGHKPQIRVPKNYKKCPRCPKCSNRCPEHAMEKFISIIETNGHELLSDYIDTQHKVLIDFKCGHEPYWVVPNAYYVGRKCLKCVNHCPEQAEEDLKTLVLTNGHELLSKYVSSKEKVLIDFKCGHVPHWITPHNYKTGQAGCPKCAGQCSALSKEKTLLLIEENGHELLSNYIDNTEKILIDFKCGHKPHWIAPYNYKEGKWCPLCTLSKGEKIIMQYLDSISEEYIHQYKIESFNERMSRARYDIYIPRFKLVVEINGVQHYKVDDHYNKTQADLDRNILKDINKYYYALENELNYIDIDYREHKPELALERFIKQFNEFLKTYQEEV